MGDNRFRIIQATQEKGGYITEHTLYRYAIADLFPIWIKPYTWMQI